jgi:hypothetical protein
MDNHHKKLGKLALDALDHDAAAKDLLKPTEERACPKCGLPLHRDDTVRHGYFGPSHDSDRCIQLLRMKLETLLAENKALRERCAPFVAKGITAEDLENMSPGNVRVVQSLPTYNPETHVPMPREAAFGLKRIVEEIDGAMRHGTWRDERTGMRLKDTTEWVEYFNALTAASQEGE